MHYMGTKQQDQGQKNHFWNGREKSCRFDTELPYWDDNHFAQRIHSFNEKIKFSKVLKKQEKQEKTVKRLCPESTY